MSDNNSVSRWTFVLEDVPKLPVPGTPEYFQYLQWPSHHLTTITLRRIFDTNIIGTLQLGYAIYAMTFSIAVISFSYTHINSDDPFYIFTGSSLFLVAVWSPLNNQFVPQFFALIILIYLMTFNSKRGKKWTGIRVILFFILCLSHPYFFIFYIFANLLFPATESVKIAASNLTDNSIKNYQVILLMLKKPVRSVQELKRAIYEAYVSRSWIARIIMILVIYPMLLAFRFVLFPNRFILVLSESAPKLSRTPLGVLARLLPEPVLNILGFDFPTSTSTAETTVLLYKYIPEGFDIFFRRGTIFIVLSTLLLLAIPHLFQRLRHVSSFNIATIIGGSIYFTLGNFLPINGVRSLQIIFLPLVTAFGVLRENKAIIQTLVIILLVCSPFTIANVLVNDSITAGGNAEDFHTTIASSELTKYSNHKIIVPQQNSLPVKSRDNIVPIDTVVEQDYNTSSGDLFITGPVVKQYIRYRGYQCNIYTTNSNNNIVYNNNAKGIWLDEPFEEINCRKI